jgi:hypothetical protein
LIAENNELKDQLAARPDTAESRLREAAKALYERSETYPKYALRQMNDLLAADLAQAALSAALAVDGVALVPKEPTDTMKVAGGMKVEDIIFGGEGNHETIFDAMKDVWTAMLTAASDGEVG